MAIETVKIALEQPSGEAKGAETEEAKAAAAAAAKAAEEGKPGEQGTPKNPAEALKEAPKEEQKADESGKTEEQLKAEKAVGFDLTKYAAEYAEKGELSADSVKELEGKGVPKDLQDTYIAGLQAQAHTRLTTLAEEVGGVDAYNNLLAWGATKLSEAEKTEAVKVLSGKNVEAAKTYLVGLNARFVKENGKPPGKTSGGGGSASEDVFASRADQAAAMRDPRYQRDRKYRAEVEKKSIRSFGSKATAKKRTKKAALKNTRRARAKGKR